MREDDGMLGGRHDERRHQGAEGAHPRRDGTACAGSRRRPRPRQEKLRKLIEANHAEVQAGFDEMRRHFKVVTEDLRGGITLIAEGHAALGEKIASVDRKVTKVGERVESMDLKTIWLQEQVTSLQGQVTSLETGQRAVVAAVREMMGQQ